jgi:hypothetical protein
VLVSRNKALATTERLQGILMRDQAGHCLLLFNGPDAAAATWDRVQLVDSGPLGDIESGSKVEVTGTWDEASSWRRHSAFRVQSIETLPAGGRR